jgi:RNA polymerase sigma-B factor
MTGPEHVGARRAEDVRLQKRHRAGDRRARERLIERYLPLARRLAWRYRATTEPLDDLVQVASLGLVKAVDRWDPDRGHTLSTFAVPTILGELRRHFRDATWVVRPPRGLQELAVSIDKSRGPLMIATGREPTVADFARRLELSPDVVAEALRAAEGRTVQSLDGPALPDGDDAATRAGAMGAEDDGYAQVEARATLERLCSGLDRRAREILRLRYEHDLLQAEIADRVGCSQVHVSRNLRASLERLSASAFASAAA